MRRHHLIEEAKTELDVAYEEVKRAEHAIMELEQQYNDRIREIREANGAQCDAKLAALMSEKEEQQIALDVDSLYDLQSRTIERFAVISSAFTIVATVEDKNMSLDLIRKVLFREGEIRQSKVKIDTALRTFIHGLKEYMWVQATSDHDRTVRDSWRQIEDLLKEFGRNL